MKNPSTCLVLALALFLLMAGTALAREIVVFNGTDFKIMGLYMSSSDNNSWGDDLLGEDILEPGEGLSIHVEGTPNNLDMAVIDDEQQKLVFMKLDFRGFESLTLYSDGTGRFE